MYDTHLILFYYITAFSKSTKRIGFKEVKKMFRIWMKSVLKKAMTKVTALS